MYPKIKMKKNINHKNIKNNIENKEKREPWKASQKQKKYIDGLTPFCALD